MRLYSHLSDSRYQRRLSPSPPWSRSFGRPATTMVSIGFRAAAGFATDLSNGTAWERGSRPYAYAGGHNGLGKLGLRLPVADTSPKHCDSTMHRQESSSACSTLWMACCTYGPRECLITCQTQINSPAGRSITSSTTAAQRRIPRCHPV